ncbi:MAG: hypothetical protein AB9882_05690 [Ignavibacteriaceae bacterium]
MSNSIKTVIILFFFTGVIFGQDAIRTRITADTILVDIRNHYRFSGIQVIPESEIVRVNGRILKPGEYSVDYKESFIKLSDTLSYSIYDTVFITYKSLRIPLRKQYRKRELVTRFDMTLRDTVRTVTGGRDMYSAESIFGDDIEKSGTIIRGFTIGSNKDLALQSGLRLQLNGKLSEDIDVVAALTDESTPIQPEGNTESLDELDKVFIQIKHKNAIGTFGDYELNKRYGEFGKFNKKLQGLLGEFQFEKHNGFLSIASAKGKFNSMTFAGLDGVQGPYILYGVNSEKDIIVIAGSEKVFIDGEEMKRGERNDYIIDYSNSQITFTANRMITSASRISVDFEYTDKKYVRNIFTAGGESKFFSDNLKIQYSFLQEGDDKDSPIDFALSDDDKKRLEEAGDDISKGAKSGVSLAEPDSLGRIKGTYEKRDSTIDNNQVTYYYFNPGSDSAKYYVTFTYVGFNKGSYDKESLGRYTYVGENNGDYLPIIFLPLPELKQFANLVVEYIPFKNSRLTIELAGSSWDKNRFSTKDESDNLGYARNIQFTLSPSEINLGGIEAGRVGFLLRERFIQTRFTSMERFGDVEFNRGYNLNPSQPNADESLKEINLNYLPLNNFNISSGYGSLKKGDAFSSDKYQAGVDYTKQKEYMLKYNFEYVSSKYNTLSSKWYRQKGRGEYKLWYFQPGVDFLAEDKKDFIGGSDSLLGGSLKYYEFNPGIELIDLYGFTAGVKYIFREDNISSLGIMRKESESRGYEYDFGYQGIREVNSTFKLTVREKKFSEEYKGKGFLDNQSIIVRSQSRFQFFQNAVTGDLYYETGTQKTAKLERIFVPVPKGTGNYIYLGDLNNNGIAEENEFEATLFDGDFIITTIPTDKLFPVIELKGSTRWKISFKNALGNSFPEKILSALSSETFFRLEENSSEEDIKKIYLLDFSAFRNEKTTIRGSNLFQQDIFIFENDPELSFRFRYSQNQTMNQFAGGIERGYGREKSVRVRFRLVQEISNQTELIIQDDNLAAPINSTRNRRIGSTNVLSDFSYRPTRSIEVGFVLKAGSSTDSYPIKLTVITSNGQLIRFNFSFSASGRLRLEAERNELLANTSENFLPFELVGGNQVGKNYFWRVNYEYRIATNLQTSAFYEGRQQGEGRVIHSLKAEARAFF